MMLGFKFHPLTGQVYFDDRISGTHCTRLSPITALLEELEDGRVFLDNSRENKGGQEQIFINSN